MKHLHLLIVLLLLPIQLMASDMNSANISGHDFSLLDIEKHCKVRRNGMTDTLSVECTDKALKLVVMECEGFVENGLENIRFVCGGGLWKLGSMCRVEMRDSSRGELDCKV